LVVAKIIDVDGIGPEHAKKFVRVLPSPDKAAGAKTPRVPGPRVPVGL
jgi:hypothetical protein